MFNCLLIADFADGNFFNPCKGDSGGPAVSFRSGRQVGIVSWSAYCGQTGAPSVYTNVAWFIPWIQGITGLAV